MRSGRLVRHVRDRNGSLVCGERPDLARNDRIARLVSAFHNAELPDGGF